MTMHVWIVYQIHSDGVEEVFGVYSSALKAIEVCKEKNEIGTFGYFYYQSYVVL